MARKKLVDPELAQLTKNQLIVRRGEMNNLVYLLERMMQDARAAALNARLIAPAYKDLLLAPVAQWRRLIGLAERFSHDYTVQLSVLEKQQQGKAQGKAYVDDDRAF